VIEGYRAVLASEDQGRQLRVVIGVRLARHTRADVQRFERSIQQLPHLDAAFHVTGNYDYLLRAAVRDLAAYEAFHSEHLTNLQAVAHVNTHVVMNDIEPQVRRT
jgi:Lrp/AsnC family transcriptional regulator, leucine-responsive regulatory protein